LTLTTEPGRERPDVQIMEVLGRNLLVTELLRANLEVAAPMRDHGVDLIVYMDTGNNLRNFTACPIQMKAASRECFSIDRKYEPFPGMILAYVWNVFNAGTPVTYAVTYAEAFAIAEQMGYTRTDSWCVDGRYTCTRIGEGLRQLLQPHLMTPEKWRRKIAQLHDRAVAVSGQLPQASVVESTG
jgi:hypothetical protein